MTKTHDAPTLGIDGLAAQSDEDYGVVVLDNVFRHKRNQDTWERLMSEALIYRTRDALTTILERHLAAVRRRNAEWLDRKSSEFIEDFDTELAAYKQRHRRDSTFTGCVQQALSEATTTARRYNVASSNIQEQEHNQVYRLVIGELVRAIQRHRATNAAANVIPEPADEELWAVLDSVKAPNGGGLVPVTEFGDLPPLEGLQR